MNNLIEKCFSLHPDLEFWEAGKAAAIRRGFAVVTLRKPGTEFDYSPGERVMAFCRDSDEKVPIVILNNYQAKLKDFSPLVLALDSYFSTEEAASDLRQYPGYEKTTKESEMQAFTFISAQAFDKLSKWEKEKIYKTPIFEFMKSEKFRHLFLPTMCHNLSRKGGNIFAWIRFLQDNNVLDEWDVGKIVDYSIKSMQRLEDSKKLKALSVNTASLYFKPFVLGIYS